MSKVKIYTFGYCPKGGWAGGGFFYIILYYTILASWCRVPKSIKGCDKVLSNLWTIWLLSRYAIPSAISAAMRTILSSEGVSKFCTFPGLGQQRIYRLHYIVYLRFLKKFWRSPFSKNSMRRRTGWDLVTIPSRATTCSDL